MSAHLPQELKKGGVGPQAEQSFAGWPSVQRQGTDFNQGGSLGEDGFYLGFLGALFPGMLCSETGLVINLSDLGDEPCGTAAPAHRWGSIRNISPYLVLSSESVNVLHCVWELYSSRPTRMWAPLLEEGVKSPRSTCRGALCFDGFVRWGCPNTSSHSSCPPHTEHAVLRQALVV